MFSLLGISRGFVCRVRKPVTFGRLSSARYRSPRKEAKFRSIPLPKRSCATRTVGWPGANIRYEQTTVQVVVRHTRVFLLCVRKYTPVLNINDQERRALSAATQDNHGIMAREVCAFCSALSDSSSVPAIIRSSQHGRGRSALVDMPYFVILKSWEGVARWWFLGANDWDRLYGQQGPEK